MLDSTSVGKDVKQTKLSEISDWNAQCTAI